MNKKRYNLVLLFIILFLIPIISLAEVDISCGLKNVYINGEEIENFVYTKIGYSIEVDSSVEKISIDATPIDKDSTVTSIKNKTIIFGDNSFQIVCTNSSGDRRIYSFIISKYGSSEVSLEYIKVDGKIVDGYTSNVFNYTLSVEPKVEKVTIDAKPIDSTMTVTGTGVKSLKEGKNTFAISCKSANGSEYIYYVKIVKGKSDLSLSNIKINNKDLDKFSSNSLTYSWKVDESVKKVLVEANTTDPKSIVTGTGEYELEPGLNTIKLKVTGEDSKTRIYTLMIQKGYEEILDSYSGSSVNNDSKGNVTVYTSSIIDEESKEKVDKVLDTELVLTKPWIIAIVSFVFLLIVTILILRKAREIRLDNIDKNDEIRRILKKGRKDKKV